MLKKCFLSTVHEQKICLTGMGKLSHCRTKVIEASNCATGSFEKMFQIL